MGWCKVCANLVAIEDADDPDHLLAELDTILSELKKGKPSLRWFKRKEPNDGLDFRIAEVRDAIMRRPLRKNHENAYAVDQRKSGRRSFLPNILVAAAL